MSLSRFYVWVLAECPDHYIKPLSLMYRDGNLYYHDGTPAITYDDGRTIYFTEEVALQALGGI